jgi:hypothetical protein
MNHGKDKEREEARKLNNERNREINDRNRDRK